MNRIYLTTLFALLILIAMILETTIVALPLVYLVGAFFLIFLRRVRIYVLVFLLAFFTDSLRVTNFGLTPLFLIGLCIVIFVYEKYSGSDDKLVSSFLIAASSIIYAHYFAYSVNATVLLIVVLGAGWYLFDRYLKKGGLLL